MIQVYSPGNENFTANGNMTLFPSEATVHVILNSSWEASVTHPLDEDGRWKYLIKDAVIKLPSFNGEQLFRIKKTEDTMSGITATAEPIFFDAKGDCFLVDVRPTDKTGQEALDIMCAAEGDGKYSGSSDITTTLTAYYEYKNLLEAISGDIDQSFLNRWGGEILYDNFTVIINSTVGEDNGVELRYGKNIPEDGMAITEDVSDVVTRIYPKAYNGRTMTDDGYVDSEHIDDYPTVHAQTITFEDIKLIDDCDYTEDDDGNEVLDEDDDVTVCEDQDELDEALKNACEEQFSDGIDLPSVTIEADMVLLQDTDQYADLAILETVSLGDTVHCINTLLDFETEARVIELEYDCLLCKVTAVVLGDYETDFLTSTSESVSALTESVSDLKTSVSEFYTVVTQNLYAVNADIVNLTADVGSFTDLLASYASIEYLQANYTITTEIDAMFANLENIYAKTATVTELLADYVTATTLDTVVAEIGLAYITSAEVETLLAGYVSTETLSAVTADIESLTSDVADIKSLYATTASVNELLASYVTADELSAVTAEIGALETTYASIDFANVDIASISTGFVSELLIAQGFLTESVTADTASITGYLTSVGIIANYITAGTLDCANLTVSNLTVGSLLVDTINGYTLADGTVSSTTLDDLLIEIIDAVNTNDEEVEQALEEAGLATTEVSTLSAKAVVSSVAYYYQSTSAAELSGGNWSTTAPEWTEGTYIWTRDLVTYGNGSTVYSEAVCITGNTGADGADGEDGEDGADGADGISITISSKSVTYQASSSGTTTPTGTWSSSVPSVSQGSYLWTKTVVTYSDGTSTTAYSVSYIGVDGADGADGADGEDGADGADGTSITISSKSVTYQASSSGTTTPTGTWSSSVPSVSQGQYLWTKTVVTYSDGTSTTAYSVSYIAVDGTDGTDGADGTSVSVSSTSVTYLVSSSGTTTPTGTWSSSVPSVSQGYYLWTRTIVTYSDGVSTTSYSVSYCGIDGDPEGELSEALADVEEQLETVTSIANGKSTTYYAASAPSSTDFDLCVNDIWFDSDGGYAMYMWDGTAWELCQFSTGALAASSITASLIASSAVTAAKISSLAVTTDKLAAEAVTAAKIATGTITATQIASGTITADEIASGTITGTNIASGTITADNITVGTITGDLIASETISADNIVSGTITTTQIAASTITGSNIAGTTITATNLASSCVTAAKISSGAVTTAKLDAEAVTTAKLAADAVTAEKIAAATITADEIAADTITGDNIASETITAANLAADCITATQISSGAVTADKISVSDLSALSATIGGFTIGETAIYSSYDSFGSYSSNIYIGSSGISLGTRFQVTYAGALTATSGKIGNITLSTIGIYAYNSSYSQSYAGIYRPTTVTSDSIAFYAGAASSSGAEALFSVTYGGYLEAIEASIEGDITANSLILGDGTITVEFGTDEGWGVYCVEFKYDGGASAPENYMYVSTEGCGLYSGLYNDDASEFESYASIDLEASGEISMFGNVYFYDNVYLMKSSGTAGYTANRTDTGSKICFCVGSGGENRGIYDSENSKWLFYADEDDDIHVGTSTIGGTKNAVYLKSGVPTSGIKVDYGSVSITPSAANTPTSKSVTYSTSFSSTPMVVAVANSSVPGTVVTGVGVTSRSTTGCTIYVSRTNTTSTTVFWIAVGY